MQLSITGHHIEVTPALRERIATKIERVERHFDNTLGDVHVILSVEKQRHKAEATIGVRGARLHAESIEPDMYAAIDGLIDKLDRRVKKHKEKMGDHHARHARKPKFG